MHSVNEYAELFCTCFPELEVSESIIAEKLRDVNFISRYHDSGKLAGFSAVKDNSVVLLCVHPDFRGQGTGGALLRETEQYIRERGHRTAVLGRSSCDLFFGAVIDNMSHRFFEKHGYRAFNGCLSMLMYADEFSCNELTDKYPVPEGVKFRISENGADEGIISAVEKVEPKWTKYYENCGGRTVITAEISGRTSGFITADADAATIATDTGCRTGRIDYVGVVPEERNKGTGTALVAYTLNYLKNKGCTEIFIGYTSLDTWYQRFGFEDYLWYWMGEKEL